jgi:hypothetical protein
MIVIVENKKPKKKNSRNSLVRVKGAKDRCLATRSFKPNKITWYFNLRLREYNTEARHAVPPLIEIKEATHMSAFLDTSSTSFSPRKITVVSADYGASNDARDRIGDTVEETRLTDS